MTARIYAVYSLATRKDGPLYIGITSDLERRIAEHKTHAIKGHPSPGDGSFYRGAIPHLRRSTACCNACGMTLFNTRDSRGLRAPASSCAVPTCAGAAR